MTSLFHSVLQAYLNDTYSDKFLGVILISSWNLANFNLQQSKLGTVVSFAFSHFATWDDLDSLNTVQLLCSAYTSFTNKTSEWMCSKTQESNSLTCAITILDSRRVKTCEVIQVPKFSWKPHISVRSATTDWGCSVAEFHLQKSKTKSSESQ